MPQNFAATATDSQLGPAGLTNPDGSRNDLGLFLQNLDLSFTAIFTAELLVNMFAHWFFPVRPPSLRRIVAPAAFLDSGRIPRHAVPLIPPLRPCAAFLF